MDVLFSGYPDPAQPKMLCDVCGKDFNDASNLRRHKLTHNARQKAFKYELCDKAFARSDHLKKHAEAMHALRSVLGLCASKVIYFLGVCS